MSEAVSRTTETHSSRFDEIYRAYSGELTAYARRLTSNPTEAEDWVAEAFVRTMAATERGRGPTENVRAYLFTAVRSIRAEQNRSTVVHLHRADLGTDHPDLVESDRADQVVDTAVASSAFKRLPARWQQVLTLTAVEDADLGEAASRLGISKGATAVLAFRAREGLRTAYLEEWITAAQQPECLEPRAKLARLVRDQLKGAEAAVVQAHVDGCEECSGAVLMLHAEAAQMRAVPIWVFLPSAGSLVAAGSGAGAGVSWESLRALGQQLVQRLRDNPAQTAGAATVAAVAAAALAVAGGGPSDTQQASRTAAPTLRTTTVSAEPPATQPEPEPAPTTDPPPAPAPEPTSAPKQLAPTSAAEPADPPPTVPVPGPVTTSPPAETPAPREHPVHTTHPGTGTKPPTGPPASTPGVQPPATPPHPSTPVASPTPVEPPFPEATAPSDSGTQTDPATQTESADPPSAEDPQASPSHSGPGSVSITCSAQGSMLGGVAGPVCVLVAD